MGAITHELRIAPGRKVPKRRLPRPTSLGLILHQSTVTRGQCYCAEKLTEFVYRIFIELHEAALHEQASGRQKVLQLLSGSPLQSEALIQAHGCRSPFMFEHFSAVPSGSWNQKASTQIGKSNSFI